MYSIFIKIHHLYIIENYHELVFLKIFLMLGECIQFMTGFPKLEHKSK